MPSSSRTPLRPAEPTRHARPDAIANLESGALLDWLSEAEAEDALLQFDEPELEELLMQELVQELPVQEMPDLTDAVVSLMGKRSRPPAPKGKNTLSRPDQARRVSLCKHMRA